MVLDKYSVCWPYETACVPATWLGIVGVEPQALRVLR